MIGRALAANADVSAALAARGDRHRKHRFHGIVALVAFSFGFYQLWSVNREIRRDREAKSARDSGHAVGEHELDDR